MGLRAVKKIVVEHGGTIKILNEVEYMKLVRNEHFLTMPKYLGTLNPSDKSTIEWIEDKTAPETNKEVRFVTVETKVKANDKFTDNQKATLTSLVLQNVEMLANKGVNNFVNNFDELILKNI